MKFCHVILWSLLKKIVWLFFFLKKKNTKNVYFENTYVSVDLTFLLIKKKMVMWPLLTEEREVMWPASL